MRRRKSSVRRPSTPQTTRLRITVTSGTPALRPRIRRAARAALESKGYRRGSLEVAVINDAEMRRAHGQWMGSRTTTDVLTFDLRESPRRGLVDAQILVCEPVARRASRERGHPVWKELALYVVHGCLHLAGRDDLRPADAQRMHREEDRILKELGYGPVFSPSTRRRART